MSSHTVESYDKDLSKLRSNIIDMAILVRDMIIIADKSLQEKNESFAEIAKTTDEKINRFDSEIETRATNILALRQPMAIDLRESIAALKLAVILERMGDLAKHISNRVEKVSATIDKDSLGKIHKMSEINIYRIINAIKAYKNSDVHLAKEIFIKDKEVDHIYAELMLKLEEDIVKNPANTKLIIQIIYAIKNLERIGDYISKVVTLVNYIITGERKIFYE